MDTLLIFQGTCSLKGYLAGIKVLGDIDCSATIQPFSELPNEDQALIGKRLLLSNPENAFDTICQQHSSRIGKEFVKTYYRHCLYPTHAKRVASTSTLRVITYEQSKFFNTKTPKVFIAFDSRVCDTCRKGPLKRDLQGFNEFVELNRRQEEESRRREEAAAAAAAAARAHTLAEAGTPDYSDSTPSISDSQASAPMAELEGVIDDEKRNILRQLLRITNQDASKVQLLKSAFDPRPKSRQSEILTLTGMLMKSVLHIVGQPDDDGVIWSRILKGGE